MALTTEEQELVDLARAILPDWFTSSERVQEDLGMMAKAIGAARAQATAWLSRTQILVAEGATVTDPDWLDQHARDRGTSRQTGETDVALRTRLRNIEDVVTRTVLMDQVAAILTAAGVAGTPVMLELRRDRIYLGELQDRSGTGGTFALVSGTTCTFTPTVPFVGGIEVGYPRPGGQGASRLVVSGAANAGNNGTFPITDLAGAAAVFTNASGVAATDATATWVVRHYDVDGNVRSSAAGLRSSYLSRGHRLGGHLPRIVVILPYGTSADTATAIEEMLRVKKAAGVAVTVERRLIP